MNPTSTETLTDEHNDFYALQFGHKVDTAVNSHQFQSQKILNTRREIKVYEWLSQKGIQIGEPTDKQTEFHKISRLRVSALRNTLNSRKVAMTENPQPIKWSQREPLTSKQETSPQKSGSLPEKLPSTPTEASSNSETLTPDSKSTRKSDASPSFSSLLQRRSAGKNLAWGKLEPFRFYSPLSQV